MNKKYFQSNVALSAAIIFTLSAMTSCKSSEKAEKQEVKTADKVLTASYSSVELDLSLIDNYEIYSARYCDSNSSVYLEVYDNTNFEDVSACLYKTNLDFSSFEKLELQLQENEIIAYYDINPTNGKLGILTSITTYDGMDISDYKEENIDEEFDWEDMQESEKTTYSFKIYDENLNLESEATLSDEECDEMYLNELYLLDNDNFLIYDSDISLSIYDKNGNKISSVDSLPDDVEWIDSLGRTNDGFAFTYYTEKGNMLAEIDIETLELKNTTNINNFTGYLSTIVPGNEDYSFFLSSSEGLFGKKGDELEEVINWIDSDLNGDNILQVFPLENGDFIAIIIEDESVKAYNLTKRDVSELSDTVIVTLGTCYIDEQLSSLISEFNRENTDCRIKVKNYDKYNTEENEYTGAGEQLNNDILKGEGPDIIDASSFENYAVLESKGCFADLYPLLDKDDEITRDTFLPNVIKMNEKNGKLYSIPTCFYINTLAGKTKYVGEKENWTIDELIETYENAPDDMKLMADADKESLLSFFIYGNINGFIDYDKKECNFNSPEMIKLLNFCDTFETFEADEIDWENLDESYWQQQQYEYEYGMINDIFLLYNAYISNFREFHELAKGYFNGEPFTFVGFPTTTGSGIIFESDTQLAINANSAVTETAWRFIKKLYTEKYQDMLDYSFPVNINSFNKAADAAQNPQKDSEGTVYEEDDIFFIGDEEIKIGYMNDEEKERYKNYLLSASEALIYDAEIYKIFEEEITEFIEEDKTAEETAEMIQNRAEIYINEQG